MAEQAQAQELAEVRQEPSGRRRRSSRSRRGRASHSGLRLVYFSLASLWGFVSGTVAVLAGLTLADQPLRAEPTIVGLILVAAALAVAGGMLAAMAYKDAARQ